MEHFLLNYDLNDESQSTTSSSSSTTTNPSTSTTSSNSNSHNNSSSSGSSSFAFSTAANAFSTPMNTNNNNTTTTTNTIATNDTTPYSYPYRVMMANPSMNHSSSYHHDMMKSSSMESRYYDASPPPVYMEPTTITAHTLGVPSQNNVILSALLQYVENIAKSVRENAQIANETPIVIDASGVMSSNTPQSDDSSQMDSFSDFMF